MTKTESIHVYCTGKEKIEIEKRAKKLKRSISNYLLFMGLHDHNDTIVVAKIPKKTINKDIPIVGIKPKIAPKKTIGNNYSQEVINSRKNLF